MGSFRDPGIPHGEASVYRCTVSGRELGRGRQVIEHASVNGRSFYRQTLEGSILDRGSLTAEVLHRRRNGRVLAESHSLDTQHDGDPVSRSEMRFRDVEMLAMSGGFEPFPSDLSPVLGCAITLRGLDFERGSRDRFYLWLANGLYWPVYTRVDDRRPIDTPAGRFTAWRVRVWPSLESVAPGVHSLVEMVLPRFYLFFDAEPPHRFLRFEFPAGPFQLERRGIIELLEAA